MSITRIAPRPRDFCARALADPALHPALPAPPEDDLDRAARQRRAQIIEAAVLVPLVLHREPTVLLTLRVGHG